MAGSRTRAQGQSGLGWIAGGGVIFIGSFALTNALRLLPAPLTLVGILGSLAVDLALFLWTSRVLPNRKVPWPALLPGAALGAIGLEVLKLAGSFYVPHAVATSSALYGSLGVIFAVIAWLFFFARLVVYAAVLNVVLWERRHGTVMVAIDVPQLPGVAPLDVTRAGQVSGSQVEVT